jgi:hypothetical protein
LQKEDRWPTFTPPEAGLSRRYRGLVLHRRSHIQEVIEHMHERASSVDETLFTYIWQGLTLDELAKPELSGAAAKLPHGEPELF